MPLRHPSLFVHLEFEAVDRKLAQHNGYWQVEVESGVARGHQASVACDVVATKLHLARERLAARAVWRRMKADSGLERVALDAGYEPGSQIRRARLIGRLSNSQARSLRQELAGLGSPIAANPGLDRQPAQNGNEAAKIES
jgi:hypothetical protein